MLSTHVRRRVVLTSGGSASGDSRASGTYRLRGSTLVAQFDGGGQATFRVELVRGGALKINRMLFIRE